MVKDGHLLPSDQKPHTPSFLFLTPPPPRRRPPASGIPDGRWIPQGQARFASGGGEAGQGGQESDSGHVVQRSGSQPGQHLPLLHGTWASRDYPAPAHRPPNVAGGLVLGASGQGDVAPARLVLLRHGLLADLLAALPRGRDPHHHHLAHVRQRGPLHPGLPHGSMQQPVDRGHLRVRDGLVRLLTDLLQLVDPLAAVHVQRAGRQRLPPDLHHRLRQQRPGAASQQDDLLGLREDAPPRGHVQEPPDRQAAPQGGEEGGKARRMGCTSPGRRFLRRFRVRELWHPCGIRQPAHCRRWPFFRNPAGRHLCGSWRPRACRGSSSGFLVAIDLRGPVSGRPGSW